MEQYHFLNRHINLACEKIGTFLESSNVEHHELLRTRHTFEKVLLEYQDKFGKTAAFKVRYKEQFHSIKIEIIVAGESYNPVHTEDDEIIQCLLARIGLAPAWSYKNGKNHIVFILRKKAKPNITKIILAIGLAVAAGLILNLFPDGIEAGINKYLLDPITNAFIRLISALSGPLIFLSILSSILSMDNMETLGKIGSKTLKVILLHTIVISVLMTVLGSLFYHVELSGGASNFSQILDLIYDIIPSNLFEPFVTGNALQLIFISVITGLAMLSLSYRVNGIFSFVEQLNSIAETILSGLHSILPVQLFVLLTKIISSGNPGFSLSIGKMIAVSLLLCIICCAGHVFWISFRKKVSPALLLEKALPTWIITLTTASSSAAFGINTRDAIRKFGINKKLIKFAAPIGQILFMPGFVALLFGMEMSFAESCGIPITVPWLIIGLFTNILLSFAVPPVPGGAMISFTIAFLQLGIPMEVMGIALAVNTILDFPVTACNILSWQLTLLDVAESLDMLNKKILHKSKEDTPKHLPVRPSIIR